MKIYEYYWWKEWAAHVEGRQEADRLAVGATT
jgi:hypothetical protein